MLSTTNQLYTSVLIPIKYRNKVYFKPCIITSIFHRNIKLHLLKFMSFPINKQYILTVITCISKSISNIESNFLINKLPGASFSIPLVMIYQHSFSPIQQTSCAFIIKINTFISQINTSFNVIFYLKVSIRMQ